MYYKEYGNTGMMVSAIGLGTMRFDNEDTKANRIDKCAEIPLYAFEKGINYVDTSPLYCNDKSEIIIGRAVSQIDRKDVYLSSKTNFGILGNNPSRDDFRRKLETTLDRLQTDYLDFYHLWCMLSLKSLEEHMDKMYRYYEEAKDEGLIRNIVFSSHMEGAELEKAVELNKFQGMLIGYNALNYQFRQNGIEKAYQNGMGVVVMNPLGGGMIANNPDTFSYLTEGTDLTVPQAGLRFVASHKEITITLSGCSKLEHVDDAVKAVEGLEVMPAKKVVAKYKGKGVAFDNLCTGCGYCSGCPKGIEIPKFMDAYNCYILSNDRAMITDRLARMWKIDINNTKNCIACGKCERECTQHLPIIERLKEIRNMA